MRLLVKAHKVWMETKRVNMLLAHFNLSNKKVLYSVVMGLTEKRSEFTKLKRFRVQSSNLQRGPFISGF